MEPLSNTNVIFKRERLPLALILQYDNCWVVQEIRGPWVVQILGQINQFWQGFFNILDVFVKVQIGNR